MPKCIKQTFIALLLFIGPLATKCVPLNGDTCLAS